MILILLFVVIPAITIVFAMQAEKKKAKFFFGMQPDEIIYDTADNVNYTVENKVLNTTGLLYLTGKRFIFFKYKYGFLGFIPFFGKVLEPIFIDEQLVFEIPLSNILTYHFKKTTYVTSRNRAVIGIACDVTVFTKNKEEIKLVIPMADSRSEKPEILMHVDLLLLEK